MPQTITIDPVTRIEGHLKIEVTIDIVNGIQQVIDSKSTGAMFRGFEVLLQGRDPLDAPHLTQRICGVCPISHGMAACLSLESAFGITAPDNGRILRNLVLGANFIQSHILHFYHLAAADYINTAGILDMPPWMPRYITADMVGGNTALNLVNNYITALEMRRKAHQMGAIFGGKLPCSPSFVPGGCTAIPTTDDITAFRTLLTTLRNFIDNTYLPDVLAVAGAFPQYYHIGGGCGNLLAYGVFDLNAGGSSKLLSRGTYTDGSLQSLDLSQISEFVQYSWYGSSTDLDPAYGETVPNAYKAGAYSWIKAPRYMYEVHEVGPLARMWINGDYRNGISVLDRIAARAYECKKVADAMDGWLNQLTPDASGYIYHDKPTFAMAVGLTEAPRGAVGHWLTIRNSVIGSYQIVTPTGWNASPRDDLDQMGAIEQALLGTPVNDINKPIEVLRVIHSFDPCLSCSVHMIRPDSKVKPLIIDVPASPV